jgi:hypothetical protein
MSLFNLTVPVESFDEMRFSRLSALTLWLGFSAGGWSLILRLI